MSFNPPSMTTAAGCRKITSCRNRISHLISGLPRDPSIQPTLTGEELRISPAPIIRDLIAEKDHAILSFRGRRQLRVIAAVANQPPPVLRRPLLLMEFTLERLDTIGRGILPR